MGRSAIYAKKSAIIAVSILNVPNSARSPAIEKHVMNLATRNLLIAWNILVWVSAEMNARIFARFANRMI